MKRIFTLITLLLLTMSAYSQDSRSAVAKNELMDLITGFKIYPDFEVVRLGGVAMGAVKGVVLTAMALDDNPEIRTARHLIKGIKRVAVVNYSDCSDAVRNRFNRRLDTILKGIDPLMEVKDDGQNMKLYGVVPENGSKLKDFIVSNPEDGMLICLFGSIDMDVVARMVSERI